MHFAPVFVCLGIALVTSTTNAIAGEPQPRQPAVYERKDASGRLLTRIVFNADGTVHRTAMAYGLRGARIHIESELDKARNPIAEKRDRFDEEGRIVERRELSVVDGQRTKTRTTYTYDALNRQTSRTEVEP